MIKPIVNRIVEDGGLQGLIGGVTTAAIIYARPGALSALGYTQIIGKRSAEGAARYPARSLLASAEAAAALL